MSAGAERLAPGVASSLAHWRAKRYRDLRYSIDASIAADTRWLQGRVDLEFRLARRTPILLDWCARGGARAEVLEVNGIAMPAAAQNNEHIEIAPRFTRAGRNRVAIRFRSPIAVSGRALVRFHDAADGSDYVYSLFVPADARTVFPCFDQPDLKARLALTLDVPRRWRVIGNAPEVASTIDHARGRKRVQLAPTEPISTYLFAFAAGPFAAIPEADAGKQAPRRTILYVRRSQARRLARNARSTLALNRAAVDYFIRYTGHRFPFAKYDLVLIPEFAFNGMEHAGATFLREEAMALPAQASASDRYRRAHLIFHEAAHQWFGNLVTMRWFDDLWIKEGFANLMAAKTAAHLLDPRTAWLAFAGLKQLAYRVDTTRGATPLRQRLPNLDRAKSAYGDIVYSKAPAALHQLSFDLGEAVFRRGVRRLLADHAYGTVDWRALIDALEAASGRDLSAWARAWVHRAGLPNVRLQLDRTGDGRVRQAWIEQRAAGRGRTRWPQRIAIWSIDARGRESQTSVRLGGLRTGLDRTRVPALERRPVPRVTLLNDGDFGYGIFQSDAANRVQLAAALPAMSDPLRRMLVWHVLWEAVRADTMTPHGFLDQMMAALPGEHEPAIVTTVLDRAQIAFRRYLRAAEQAHIAPRLEAMLLNGIDRRPRARAEDNRAAYLRTFASVALSAASRDRLHRWILGRDSGSSPGLDPSLRDRFAMAQRLAILADRRARPAMQRLARGQRAAAEGFLYASGAGWREAKQAYFDAFVADRAVPEAWIEDALAPFNAPEHASETLPLLPRALALVPALQRTRKIFFINRWLAAFVGGQTSRGALDVVDATLTSRKGLAPDLRRKILEARAELAIAVRLHERHGGATSQ